VKQTNRCWYAESSIAPQAREAGPLSETGREQPARSDGSLKVRFVENHLVIGGCQERLSRFMCTVSRTPSSQRSSTGIAAMCSA
jgi:hypothetical protein